MTPSLDFRINVVPFVGVTLARGPPICFVRSFADGVPPTLGSSRSSMYRVLSRIARSSVSSRSLISASSWIFWLPN